MISDHSTRPYVACFLLSTGIMLTACFQLNRINRLQAVLAALASALCKVTAFLSLSFLTWILFPLPQVSQSQHTQCCKHDWLAAIGHSPDLGTVCEEPHRQQNKGAGITVSLAEKTNGNRVSPTGTAQRPVDDLTNSGALRKRVEASHNLALPLAPSPRTELSMKSTLTGGKPAALGNLSPVESPTDKGFDPKYSAHTPVAGENLALGWLLDPDPSKGRSLCEKVLARLIQSEAHADRPFKVDYRIAQVIVLAVERGQTDPIRYAWQSVLHCEPDQVWPNIVNNRKLKLGAEYSDWYDAHGNLKPDLQILARHEALLGTASMREPEAGETRNALGPNARVSPVPPEKKPAQPSSSGKRDIA